VTALPTGPADEPEATTVIVIDLRASAAGPDAATPGNINERTLEERQRRSQSGGIDDPSGWRLINFERLLVVDDAAEFAGHEDDYRCLIEAPTFGQMLCVVIGAPADPPYLDQPKAMAAARVPVLWLGDSRGVGWRIGKANTTRLAFSDTDPDGTSTVESLIESLTSPAVFDEIATAVNELPDRTGVPALLPSVRWVVCDRYPAAGQPEDEAPQDDNPHDNNGAARWRVRWALASLLFVSFCVVIAVAILLGVRLSRHQIGYAVADAGCAAVFLLVLLAIAYRMQVASVVRRPVLSAAPEPQPPRAAALPSEEVLARAHWMMNAPVGDEAFRQLSSPEQLVMLGGDPELARLVRFAPARARPLIEGAINGGSISWIPVGDRLGVIRLVPMKAGLVRQHGK
jgi:uncharacterized membrane protein